MKRTPRLPAPLLGRQYIGLPLAPPAPPIRGVTKSWFEGILLSTVGKCKAPCAIKRRMPSPVHVCCSTRCDFRFSEEPIEITAVRGLRRCELEARGIPRVPRTGPSPGVRFAGTWVYESYTRPAPTLEITVQSRRLRVIACPIPR